MGALAKISADGILEMAFLVEVSGHKRFFSDSSFCLVYYPHFSVLQNARYSLNRRVFLFCGFFVRIFKTRQESGFL